MHNFWRGTVSSLCLMVAYTGAYAMRDGSPGGGVMVAASEVVAPQPMIMPDVPMQPPSSLTSMAVHHDVVAGSASVSMPSPDTLIVTQTSDKAIVNWDQFNIARNEHVRFDQPGADSVILNRVTGGHGPSEILGQLSANGRVFLLNPSGVIIGQEAQIDAAGFMGSTLSMTNEDFMSGSYALTSLEGNEGIIEQHGTIRVQAGGLALISAGKVIQDGWIQAKLTYMEVEGQPTAVLDFDGDGLMSLRLPVSHQDQRPEGTVLVRPLDAQKLLRHCLNTEHCSPASHAEVKGDVVVITGGLSVKPGEVTIVGKEVVTHGLNLQATHGDHGGNITLYGDEKTDVTNTTLNGSGDKVGGAVRVTGAEVSVSKTDIHADGDEGGGSIVIGGDKRDTHPKRVGVDKDTILSANAQTRGHGGSVMVWSDDTTSFRGRIEAKAGLEGGNGGHAEVSGKITLDVPLSEASLDLSAPQGVGGTLTLDPKNVTINNVGGGTYLNQNLFGDIPGTSLVFTAVALADLEIDLILQANTDVTVTDVAASIEKSLTLQAGRSVTVEQPLTLTAGDLVITANDSVGGAQGANRDAGEGNIVIQNAITVDAGTITMGVVPEEGAFQAGTIDFDLLDNSIVSSGNQTYTSSVLLSNNTIFTSAEGNVTFEGDISGQNLTVNGMPVAANVSLQGSTDVTQLDLTGTDIWLGGAELSTSGAQTYTGLVTLTANLVEMVSGGAITFSENIRGADAAFSMSMEAAGAITFGGGSTITNLESLTISSNAGAPLRGPQTITIGQPAGSDIVLFFGGSAGGEFTDVTLNGVDSNAAAVYAALLPGTTGAYFVNGVLITNEILIPDMTTSSEVATVSVTLPNFVEGSAPVSIQDSKDPLSGEEVPLIAFVGGTTDASGNNSDLSAESTDGTQTFDVLDSPEKLRQAIVSLLEKMGVLVAAQSDVVGGD